MQILKFCFIYATEVFIEKISSQVHWIFEAFIATIQQFGI